MKRRYEVSGRVQGVGFRYFARRTATRLGLAGWVRNLPDGRVEALAEGNPEALRRFEEELRSGPTLASVREVRVYEVTDPDVSPATFDIV